MPASRCYCIVGLNHIGPLIFTFIALLAVLFFAPFRACVQAPAQFDNIYRLQRRRYRLAAAAVWYTPHGGHFRHFVGEV